MVIVKFKYAGEGKKGSLQKGQVIFLLIIMEMKKGIFLGKEDTEKTGLTKAADVDHQ